MANIKISQLTDVGNTSGQGMVLPIVDTNDTTQAPSGTTKRADLDMVINSSGYEFTGGFQAKSSLTGYVWDSTNQVAYTQQNADNGDYLRFGLSRTVHEAVDTPYWSDPTPNPNWQGFGMFGGDNLPAGKTTTLLNFDFNGWSGSSMPGNLSTDTGTIALDGLEAGDLVSVRFDYNVIPQIQNTTVDTGLWWATRDSSDNITFEFFLAGGTTFFGQGTVGETKLQRVTSTAYLASNEDVNAIALPTIIADNPVLIQPLSMLVTITK